MDITVLIVDDDASMHSMLGQFLQAAGFRVLTAASGAEALTILRNDAPPVVITDCRMPQMSGIELCRRIRADEGIGFAYVIMVTAITEPSNMTEAFDAGADDYIRKPFQKKELLARINAGVRLVRAEQRIHRERRTVFKINAELELLNRKLEAIATTDELTGLGNRRTAMDRIRKRWEDDCSGDQALSCVLIDIDHFKRCNDTFGHDAGDVVLREVATRLRQSARSGDGVYRLGGEEFLVLCPRTTAADASIVGEKLRAAIAELTINYDEETIGVTISLGVAERDETTADVTELLRAADNALYAAKRSGRNRVVVAGETHAAVNAPPQQAEVLFGHGAPDDETTRVLIVDHDAETRKLCCFHLSRAGHDVHEAEKAEQALALTERGEYDAIVLNESLPGLDGLECARQLRACKNRPRIPILMSGSRGHVDDIVTGLNAGADEYVTRPIHPTELVTRVEVLIRAYRSYSRLQSRVNELSSSNSLRAEQARAMGVLFDLARSISSADTEAEIGEMVVQSTAQLLICQRVSIMVPCADGDVLRIAAAVGLDDEIARTVRMPIGDSIAGQVYSTHKPFVANNSSELGDHPERYRTPYFASFPIAAVVVGEPSAALGVLNVTERFEHRPFNQQDLEFLDLIANMACTSIGRLRHRQAREQAQHSIVTGLATLAEYRDNDTGKHLDRVTQYALLLAHELQGSSEYGKAINEQFMHDLQLAMPLHDIGKVAVSDTILRKPGSLTKIERQTVEHHTHLGARAIQAVIDRAPHMQFLFMARDIAHHHHERFDGSGYPTGLAGSEIPLTARIAAVADVYDALTTKRPYKEAMSHEASVSHLVAGSGGHFDPEIIAAFLRCESAVIALADELKDDFEVNDSIVDLTPITADSVS